MFCAPNWQTCSWWDTCVQRFSTSELIFTTYWIIRCSEAPCGEVVWVTAMSMKIFPAFRRLLCYFQPFCCHSASTAFSTYLLDSVRSALNILFFKIILCTIFPNGKYKLVRFVLCKFKFQKLKFMNLFLVPNSYY